MVVRGDIVSAGVGRGRLCFVDVPALSALNDAGPRHGLQAEIERFEREVRAVVSELQSAVRLLQLDGYLEEAEIIRTHIYLLQDEEFHRKVHERIEHHRMAAESATEHVLAEIIEVLERSGGLFAQRASDARDVMLRLKMKLRQEESTLFLEAVHGIPNPVCAVKELFPSMVLQARDAGVAAIVVEQGTALSHAAILAKSFGIPVLRVERLHLLATDESEPVVVVDAVNGQVLLDTREDDRVSDAEPVGEAAAAPRGCLPAEVWLNIVDGGAVDERLRHVIQGVGLYRTEFLFMRGGKSFPSEREQYAAYRAVFERWRGRTVTVRTLDIGGDKSLPYFSCGPQENPYLGLRAHRIYRFHPEILVTQVRAVLKAAAGFPGVRLLYPLIETVDELFFVQGLVREAVASLEREGAAFQPDFLQGVLVEVPSAVWNFEALMRHLDFASVGTNDLLQYFFALDRNNANVLQSYRPMDPGALRMLHALAEQAERLGKPLGVCGEIASNAAFLPLLLGVGYTQVSVDAHAARTVARRLSELDPGHCRAAARECLAASSSCEVNDILAAAGLIRPAAGDPVPSPGHQAVDPVCGMVVHVEANPRVVEQAGRKYHFCSTGCMERFAKGERRASG